LKIVDMNEEFENIFQQASLAHREGRFAEAEKGYLELLEKRPHWGKVLNALGTVYLDLSRPDTAREAFQKAADLKAPYFPACYNLARLMQKENDHRGAMSIYRAMLSMQPNMGEVWNNLGIAYREIGDPDEAISCFRKAVAFAPDMAEAHNNLGVAQDEFNLIENAANSYKKAIRIRPDYPSAHYNLGLSLQKLGRYKEAGAHYQNVLAAKPDHAAARFMLQSLGSPSTPDAAPVEHVRNIFDRCAGTFEKILVKDLEYRTPALLFSRLRPHLTERMKVLDLGCGTGLGADRYRPFAKELTGVDVSTKMLEKAAEKNIYDHLAAFDILKNWHFPQKFDLIYSADVFVYFGRLDSIIRSASSYLNPGGILAFSVEKLKDSSAEYRLFPTGRYAHSPKYIRDCLKRHGLKLLDEVSADIRKQSGKPVEGLLVVARAKTVKSDP